MPKIENRYLRLLLNIEYEKGNSLFYNRKILYGLDLVESSTASDIIFDLNGKMDFGNVDVKLLSNNYEILPWLPTWVFKDGDEITVRVLSTSENSSKSSNKITIQEKNTSNIYTVTSDMTANDEISQIAEEFVTVENEIQKKQNFEGSGLKKHKKKKKHHLIEQLESKAIEQPSMNEILERSRSRKKKEKRIKKKSKKLEREAENASRDVEENVSDMEIAVISAAEENLESENTRSSNNARSSDLFTSRCLSYNEFGRKKPCILTVYDTATTLNFKVRLAEESRNDVNGMNKKIEDPLNLKHDMKISFKIQELDDDFKPQLSDWKTATVLHYNPVSEVVTLKGYKERTPAKFALLTDDSDDDNDAVNSIPWSFLVEPQIIEV
ncbi:Coilin [Trichinella spiralis]|uniref:Coilin n=1 Tax=Trichinella spiralis TaxID=6334 RepID=A0ABR3KNZ3_TRISP